MTSIIACEYDKDEIVPPQWLNKAFFERFMPTPASKHNGIIVIKNTSVKPATKKGEHYASVMFRVKVTFELLSSNGYGNQSNNKIKSFIVKALPELESEKQRLLQDSKLFETEIGIYTEVVPQLENLLRSADFLDIRFGANYLYSSLTPVKVLVFEDLTERGYEIVRGRSLTLDEIKASYRVLAQWHAAGYKLVREQPSAFEKYRHNFMTIPYIVNSSFISSGIENFINMLDSVPTLNIYKPFFQNLQPNWAFKCRSTYSEYFSNRQAEMFYGICHGDFLNNNIMFCHNRNKGELTDVLLVDYQLAYMGPLVNDLIYAYYMLYNAEQRTNDHDELLEYYFRHFVETLEKVGCDASCLTFENLKRQLKRQKYLALFLLVSFLPIRYALRAGLLERDHMMATDEERRPLYYNADYIAELHTILPNYLRLGYLE